ncbi:MAG: hypothetical protein LBD43_03145 [Holosporales bacterium]|nr:hypothetical protein [Holosporales bacterium]
MGGYTGMRKLSVTLAVMISMVAMGQAPVQATSFEQVYEESVEAVAIERVLVRVLAPWGAGQEPVATTLQALLDNSETLSLGSGTTGAGLTGDRQRIFGFKARQVIRMWNRDTMDRADRFSRPMAGCAILLNQLYNEPWDTNSDLEASEYMRMKRLVQTYIHRTRQRNAQLVEILTRLYEYIRTATTQQLLDGTTLRQFNEEQQEMLQ